MRNENCVLAVLSCSCFPKFPFAHREKKKSTKCSIHLAVSRKLENSLEHLSGFTPFQSKWGHFWSKHTNNKARESKKKMLCMWQQHKFYRQFPTANGNLFRKNTEILDAELSLNLSCIKSGSNFSVVVVLGNLFSKVRLNWGKKKIRNKNLHDLVLGNYEEQFVVVGTTEWNRISSSIPFRWLIQRKNCFLVDNHQNRKRLKKTARSCEEVYSCLWIFYVKSSVFFRCLCEKLKPRITKNLFVEFHTAGDLINLCCMGLDMKAMSRVNFIVFLTLMKSSCEVSSVERMH